jgi:tetratricopeptide (TPR) repeat protein
MVDSKEKMKDGPWLVKSGDRVLGPYSTDDLSQLIRDKEVVVIDEVMAPQSRWTYVRDVATFQSVVEEIRRGLMHSREDTDVQGYTSPIAKPTVAQPATPAATSAPKPEPESEPAAPAKVDAGPPSAADNDSTMVTQTLTATTPDLGAPTNPQVKKPSSPKAPAPQPPTPTPAAKPAAPSTNKLAMEPLPHHTKEAPKDLPAVKQYVRPKMGGGRSSTIIGSMVLILAAAFIIYSVLKSPQMTRSAGAGSDNLQTQASVAWKRGEFDRALELYRALHHDEPGEPLVAARLATLMMKLEGQTVEAKRVIESAKPNAKDEDAKSALAVASGLAALQNDDPKEAIDDFSKAESSWIASFDQGVAFAAMKDWTSSLKAFKKAGDNAVSLLMLARTHLSAGDATGSKVGARHAADEAIKQALIAAPDYQQESLLVASYIDAMLGNTRRANKEVLEAVETDPQQTADHFHDPSLSLESVGWPKLLSYCQALHKELSSRITGAMLGICLAKANRLEEATKAVDTELAKEPGNAYLHAVNAYLYTLADRDDAARASLTLSTKNGTSKLAQILSARLCMREKQDACAEDGWSKLASEPNPPIAAVTGLAQLRLQKGDAAAANALLVKAESMSPTYLPLLRLREDASR